MDWDWQIILWTVWGILVAFVIYCVISEMIRTKIEEKRKIRKEEDI